MEDLTTAATPPRARAINSAARLELGKNREDTLLQPLFARSVKISPAFSVGYFVRVLDYPERDG